jgi:phosphatidylethanolamine-binding protein (PEBP) family uncharacterized protein
MDTLDTDESMFENALTFCVLKHTLICSTREVFDMMVLRSSAFEDTQTMPSTYAKAGQNVSPPLSWENAPQGTKSFALAVVDRHPVARNFVHWLVIDMSAYAASLAWIIHGE